MSKKQDEVPRRIGGSDIPLILGVSKYGGPIDAYERCWGLAKESPKTVPQVRGTLMEKHLRESYARRIQPVELAAYPGRIKSEKYPFLSASPDDYVEKSHVVDYKTASIWTRKKFGKDGSPDIPLAYQCQLRWYMPVLKVNAGELFVVFGKDLAKKPEEITQENVKELFEVTEICTYRIERDMEAEAFLLSTVKRFWDEHVIPQKPPIDWKINDEEWPLAFNKRD